MWGRRFVGPVRPSLGMGVEVERVVLRTIPPPAPILPADESSAPHWAAAFRGRLGAFALATSGNAQS
ncbi:MAG: hypothetical protein ABMA01_23970, partial [Chthoniobacteraceae bacterium]